jgi:AraC-like DNA-binding protein
MPKPVLALCYSLINNPFTSKSREFYTEAKVFELIAHQVDTLLTPSKESIMLSPPLSKIEEEKIDYCYEQLQKDLNQPPSLLELAKGSGLSVYRMKNGFRQRYGDTPFRLLTEMRMIKAKELLEKGNQNVSEVAMEVGYSSLGTFSNAFFERFGLRPSSYKKN